jgi:hypothetical protein
MSQENAPGAFLTIGDCRRVGAGRTTLSDRGAGRGGREVEGFQAARRLARELAGA